MSVTGDRSSSSIACLSKALSLLIAPSLPLVKQFVFIVMITIRFAAEVGKQAQSSLFKKVVLQRGSSLCPNPRWESGEPHKPARVGRFDWARPDSSFVTQRGHGVDPGRPARWHETSSQSHSRQDKGGKDECQGVRRAHPEQQTRHRSSQSKRTGKSDRDAANDQS